MSRIVAHRGASAAFPENTLAAFAGAASLGADGVELDVRPSAEGALVVHHDAHYPGGAAVAETSVEQRPEGVCLLDEALDVCDEHGLAVNVEIKALPGEPDHARAAEVADAVARRLVARYAGSPETLATLLVTSFWPPTINEVRAHDPRLRTGLLCLDLSDVAALVERTADAGHVALNPWDSALDEATVAAARSAGLEVNTWTVDDLERIGVLAGWGVDGIITNVPDLARQTLAARG